MQLMKLLKEKDEELAKRTVPSTIKGWSCGRLRKKVMEPDARSYSNNEQSAIAKTEYGKLNMAAIGFISPIRLDSTL